MTLAGRGVSVAAWVALAACAALAAGDDDGAEHERERERATVGGSIAWVSSDDLDLMGDVRADVPFRVSDDLSAFVRLDTLIAIEKAESDFTFLVRDVNYRLEIGARRGALAGEGWSAFAGQAGRYAVDRRGEPFTRYVGAGWRSTSIEAASGLAGGLPRWSGSAAVAWVFDDRDQDADVLLRADLAYRRPWRGLEVGFDLSLDGFGRLDDGTFDADLRGGVRFGWARGRARGGAMRYDLFVHGLRGRNPFGLGVDGVLVGLDLTAPGGFAPAGSDPFVGASMGGVLAAGAGDRPAATRFAVRADSPELVGSWRASLFLDGNVLGGDDTRELYWLYDVGFERPWRELVVGAWFYHRSNHTLARPNPVGVTSLNVLEVGADTAGWDLPDQAGVGHAWGTIDARARIGYLLDSSFGEDVRWHVRLGVRWTAPWAFRRVRPYVEAEREDGDVARTLAAVGARHPLGVGGRIEWRKDQQYFGADQEALLGLAELRF